MLGQDAQLRTEGVGGDGGVVGNDAHDKDVSTPGEALSSGRWGALGVSKSGIAGSELVGVEDGQDGRCEGVGEH